MDFSFKIYYNDKIRIIPFSRKSVNNFKKSLRQIFNFTGCQGDPEVYYLDNEGDWIFIGSRKEWQFGIKRHLISGQLKLKIVEPIDDNDDVDQLKSNSIPFSSQDIVPPPPPFIQKIELKYQDNHGTNVTDGNLNNVMTSNNRKSGFERSDAQNIINSTDIRQSLAQLKPVTSDELERSKLELSLQGQLRKNIELAKSTLNHVNTVEKHGIFSGRVLDKPKDAINQLNKSTEKSDVTPNSSYIHNRDVLLELGFDAEKVDDALRFHNNSVGDAFDYLLSQYE